MRWNGSLYADLALPFSLKSSHCIWERYASVAEWILRSRGVQHTIHYVDDFLFGGKSCSDECEAAVAIATALFKELGIPVNMEKLRLEGSPSTTIKFLVILMDTDASTPRTRTPRGHPPHTLGNQNTLLAD